MSYKLAQLSLASTQNNASIGEIFVAQTDLNKEALLGKLFIIAENHSRESVDLKLISFLLTELNKNYYQNDKAIMRERLKSITIEQVFESCLTKTNKALHDQLTSKKLEINLHSLNITIGVIHESEVYFSGIGKHRLFLIYKNKKNSEQEFNIKEISNREDYSLEINYNKIFSSLQNGAVPLQGYLFFTNEALPEYIGSKSLLDIITTLPPLGAMEQIKNKLEQVNAFVPFYAILIKNTDGVVSSEPTQRKTSNESSKSIASLRTTEAQTEKLLTPTGLIDFKNWFFRGKLALSFSKSQSNRLIMASRTVIKEKMPVRKRLGLMAISNLSNKLKLISTGLLGLAFSLAANAKHLFKRETLLSLGQKSAEQSLNLAMTPANWFGKLNKKHKIYISISIICLGLFFGNLYFMNYRNKIRLSTEFYTTTTAQIEQKENQIESNLIPKNYEGAKQLAVEARGLVNQLPKNSKPDARLDGLLVRLSDLEKRIRKETEAETKELVNLALSNSNAQPQNLALYKNKLFLGDTANKQIYQVDITSKVVNAYNKSLDQVDNLSSAALETGLLYFWNNGQIFIYNLDKLEGKNYPVIGFSQTDANIRIGIFAERAYLTSPSDRQIYRLNYTGGQFVKPLMWLKAEADVSSIKEFYLDGNAYLLGSDNRINKFVRGNNVNWTLSGVEPNLKTISSITTGDKYVYLADPDNKRIVVLDNNGKIQRQLKNDLLTNVSKMVADEKNNIVYVLNDKTIYSVSLK